MIGLHWVEQLICDDTHRPYINFLVVVFVRVDVRGLVSGCAHLRGHIAFEDGGDADITNNAFPSFLHKYIFQFEIPVDNQFGMKLFESHEDIDKHMHSGFKIEGSVFP